MKYAAVISLLLLAEPAAAIPPPEFLLQAGASLAQVWAIGFLFLASGYVVLKRWLIMASFTLRTYRWLQAVAAIGIVAASGLLAYGYTFLQQPVLEPQPPLPLVATSSRSSQAVSSVSSQGSQSMSSLSNSVVSTTAVSPKTTLQPDEYIAFIEQYYRHLSYRDIESAYDMWVQTVPYANYYGWYKDVLAVQVEDVQKLSPQKYYVVVALRELFEENRYEVEFIFDKDKQTGEVYMVDSDVNAIRPISAVTNEEINIKVSQKELSLSNATLQSMINNNESFYILDAREDSERAIGFFPDSTHIRAADLVAGAWKNLPTDVPVVVYCWSGMRGLDVAKFLQDRGLTNISFLEEGAKGWVDGSGIWEGTIEFNQHYNKPQYANLVSYDGLVEAINDNATVIDSRLQERYDQWHIPGSVNFPMMYSTSNTVDAWLSSLPPNGTFIAVCDDFLSCFDARIVGIALEQQGHSFIGRYNKPWEYRLHN